MTIQVIQGDCIEAMRFMAAQGIQVDSVVCDPPYHLKSIVARFGKKDSAPAKHGTDGRFSRQSKGFLGEKWDGGDIAQRVETWQAVHSILKPGAYLLAFSGTRTYHRMTCAIEDASFIIHPMIGWIYGQGMFKAHAINDPAWEGWGYGAQSLRPALEPICMAQKRMTEKTGTDNVLMFGTGAVNLRACQVPSETDSDKPRWPANLVHDGSDEVVASFPNAPGQLAPARTDGAPQNNNVYGALKHVTYEPEPRHDSGSAARYFYAAKASKLERHGSKHPTIKPLALMQWLCRLVTPPGGLVLDPFAGTGTTLQAARTEGFRAIGIEKQEEYIQDIIKRLAA